MHKTYKLDTCTVGGIQSRHI